MIRSILKAIRSALAGMSRFVWRRVLEGGEWVSRLFALPAEPIADEPEQAQADDTAAHLAAIRTTAAHLAAGTVPPADIAEQLSEGKIDWLTAMDRGMLCRIVGAKDEALAAHLMGQRSLKGVLAADGQAVADYRAAQRQRGDEDLDDEPNAQAALAAYTT